MTGKTICRYSKFQIEDIGGVMRDIPVTSYGNVGISWEEKDLTCQQDLIKSVLCAQGSFSTTIIGPWDNSAVQTASASGEAPKLSGSHTVLVPIVGNDAPRSFGIYFGVQRDWTADDPVFGGIDSIVVSSYSVDLENSTYSARICTAGNDRTNDPDWGIAAIAASS